MAMSPEALRHLLKKRATILYPYREREEGSSTRRV